MSILIKGMKMPETCEECPIYAACEECHYELVLEGEDFVPIYVKDSCPLVEIPPHGRLIDASEMAIKFNCRDIDITTVKKLHECLMEMPTVIESEE